VLTNKVTEKKGQLLKYTVAIKFTNDPKPVFRLFTVTVKKSAAKAPRKETLVPCTSLPGPTPSV